MQKKPQKCFSKEFFELAAKKSAFCELRGERETGIITIVSLLWQVDRYAMSSLLNYRTTATAVFYTTLNFILSRANEWHKPSNRIGLCVSTN